MIAFITGQVDKIFVAVVAQSEKERRGTAFEEIVISELKKMKCVIAERFRKGEGGGGLPDLYAYCGTKLTRIEAKETLAWHKEGEDVRPGRFVLSEEVIPKECYAFGVDDQIDGTLSIDFIKAADPDEYVRTHGKRPKYPISRLEEVRDGQRCTLPITGTIIMPRERLLELMRL